MTNELLDGLVGAEMPVEVAGLRVGLVTVLHWAQERLVTAVDKHMFPKLLDVGHDHPAVERAFTFVHMSALQDLVGLPCVLSREQVNQIVLALRLRDVLEAKELRVEVFTVHNCQGFVSVDAIMVHELLSKDFGTVWQCKAAN